MFIVRSLELGETSSKTESMELLGMEPHGHVPGPNIGKALVWAAFH